MDLPGAVSLKHFRDLFSSLKWEKLVPDTAKTVVLSGNGKFASNNFATTAIASDGSFSVSYLPGYRELLFDLSRYKPGKLTATWFDPVTGSKTPPEILPIRTFKSISSPPTDQEWVLILEVK